MSEATEQPGHGEDSSSSAVPGGEQTGDSSPESGSQSGSQTESPADAPADL